MDVVLVPIVMVDNFAFVISPVIADISVEYSELMSAVALDTNVPKMAVVVLFQLNTVSVPKLKVLAMALYVVITLEDPVATAAWMLEANPPVNTPDVAPCTIHCAIADEEVNVSAFKTVVIAAALLKITSVSPVILPKASDPILFTAAGIVKLVRLELFKAFGPMDVTEVGIVTELIGVPKRTPLDNILNPVLLGSVTLTSDVQL